MDACRLALSCTCTSTMRVSVSAKGGSRSMPTSGQTEYGRAELPGRLCGYRREQVSVAHMHTQYIV